MRACRVLNTGVSKGLGWFQILFRRYRILSAAYKDMRRKKMLLALKTVVSLQTILFLGTKIFFGFRNINPHWDLNFDFATKMQSGSARNPK